MFRLHCTSASKYRSIYSDREALQAQMDTKSKRGAAVNIFMELGTLCISAIAILPVTADVYRKRIACIRKRKYFTGGFFSQVSGVKGEKWKYICNRGCVVD